MFTWMLERGSWIIYKIGMPLVFFYYSMLSDVFFDVAAEDASFFEKSANTLLIPTQYLFEGKMGKVAYEDGKKTYHFVNRFNYTDGFFQKVAASILFFPVSFTTGFALKGLCYCFADVRERARLMSEAMHRTDVSLKNSDYEAIGLHIGNWKDSEKVTRAKYQRGPIGKHRLNPDLVAMKEVISILTEEGIAVWLDCGSCLGAYQYEGVIPHDWDIDLGVLAPDFENVKRALRKLDPEKFVMQDWSSREIEKSYLKVYVKESGNLIDIFNFAIDPEKKEISVIFSHENSFFMPQGWKIREAKYKAPCSFDDVFPLAQGVFEGIAVPVPRHIEKYLQRLYGENLAPAKVYNEITQRYEKDLNHPYWQDPHAH